MDGGSTDNSLEIIRRWEPSLAGWRSHPDKGQASAINEGIANGIAPYVYWLNSDDWLLPNGLTTLLSALERNCSAPAVYGQCLNYMENTGKQFPVWVEPFDPHRMAVRCIISQPATLIRRTSWDAVGGLNPELHMAMDYDLWWRLYKSFGPLHFVDSPVAVNRVHNTTKTNTQRRLHYREAISVVRRYNGYLPLKWWLAQPYAVWFKSLKGCFSK